MRSRGKPSDKTRFAGIRPNTSGILKGCFVDDFEDSDFLRSEPAQVREKEVPRPTSCRPRKPWPLKKAARSALAWQLSKTANASLAFA
jgi:hypothetical protein